MRGRVMRAVTEFIDVESRSDAETAELMRELDIDIAVDLAGLTQGARLNILAQRAAPDCRSTISGYPGTTGTPFIDYIVADPTVIPPATRRALFGARRLSAGLLPGQRSPAQNCRSDADASRLGLPESAFVFCVFNS